MHAYLIIGAPDQAKLQVQTKAKDNNAKVIEFSLEKISDVRDLNNFTKLKVTESTAIVINNFDKASQMTQNAFLKALEEPQENLIYILTAFNVDVVLPTVISRCEVIEVNSEQHIVGGEKEKVENFIKAEIGEKLASISKINKREEAIEFMKNIIILEHEKLMDAKWPWLAEALSTLRNLEANGNVQLQLTRFVANSHPL